MSGSTVKSSIFSGAFSLPSEKGSRFFVSTAVFSSYIFVFMTANTLQNQWFAPMGSNDVQLGMYYIQQFFMLLGFLLYAIITDLISKKAKAVLRVILVAAFSAGMLLLYSLRIPVIFFVFEPICVLVTGFSGGLVYDHLAGSFPGDKDRLRWLSLIIGIGGATAVLIQWLFQFLISDRPVLLFILISGMAAIHYISVNNGSEEHESVNFLNGGKRDIVILVSVVAAILIMLVLYEVHMNSLLFTVYFFDWPRLITMAGYILIAISGCFGRRDIVSSVMLCIALPVVLLPLLMQDMGEFYIHMSIFYLALGTTVSYYSLMFVFIAPAFKHRAIIASMGRMLDLVITILFGLIKLSSRVTELQAALTEILIMAFLLIVMKSGGLLSRSGESVDLPEGSGKDKDIRPEASVDIYNETKVSSDPVEEFAREHGFTPREIDVYRMLVTSERRNQEIADELFISRRALQNHIRSIYEKAGVSNRSGLIMALHSSSAKNIT